MNDRIKLAEAMGWTHMAKRVGWWMPPGVPESTQCWSGEDELPDPFTDANDDYAVLEWMRSQSWPAMLPEKQADRLMCALTRECGEYKVGDYARAALKALQESE